MTTTDTPLAGKVAHVTGAARDAAARRLREEGLDGAGIVSVMRDAGLTHGAFYSHFDTKDELANSAFVRAISTGRPKWIKPTRGEAWAVRLTSLAKHYLTAAHRDDPSTSCAFTAVGADAARASDKFAMALMAVCVGGLSETQPD